MPRKVRRLTQISLGMSILTNTARTSDTDPIRRVPLILKGQGKSRLKFELKQSSFGKLIEITPLYILSGGGTLEQIAFNGWQICDPERSRDLAKPNGYAWQGGNNFPGWNTELHKKEANILKKATDADCEWTELYYADGLSHQVSPNFTNVVRLYNGNFYEDRFGIVRFGEFFLAHNGALVTFKVYYMYTLNRVTEDRYCFPEVRFGGIEDAVMKPLIARAVTA